MKSLSIILLALVLSFSFAVAAEEGTEETPTLSNPAQAQKAENVAQGALEAAQQSDPAVQEAQAALDAAQTEEEKAAAQAALDAARANVVGVSSEEIADMRAQGMGWGDIAHELGVHPSALGLGHSKQAMKTERNRNTKGFDTNDQSASKGGGKALGLSGKADKSSQSNNSGGKGGKGNSGNSSGKGGGNNGNGGGKNK